MLPAGVPIPSSSQSNQSINPDSPIVVDLTATTEEHVVTKKPTAAELSHLDSPTNKQQQTTSSPLNQSSEQHVISNLECHYSGELPEYQKQTAAENPPKSTKTQEKAIP